MRSKMKVKQLSAVIIILSSIHSSLALDVCKDTDNASCQSCGDSAYPRDQLSIENCMKSCGVCTGTNISLGKPTVQSSTYDYYSSNSSNAVDGNTDNRLQNFSCTHTNNNGNEWWCVDLLLIYNFDNIKLFNRDSIKERLQGFEIKTSSSGTCNQVGFSSATSCYKDISSTVRDIYTIERCNQPSSTSTSISARTVYVTVSSQYLTLCEVQIFSDIPTNVALRQQPVQSSTRYGGVASRAVDGNTNGDFNNGSCTHTQEGQSGWWCVDLQQLYHFKQIKIYNRQHTRYWGRLQRFEIKTSSSGQCSEQGLESATSCYKDTISETQLVYTVAGCNQPSSTSFSGRTVHVKSFNDALVMCEVEIFTDLAQCNTGYYSTSSSTCQPCNTCLGDRCDPSNGVCTGDCKTGFYGTQCQQSCSDGCLISECSKSGGRCNACKPDTVGPYCNLTCGTECQPIPDQTSVTCDRNGRCTNCIIGGYGDRCHMNCSKGCDGGCDRNSGRCTSCIKGRYGDRCDMNCSTGCDGGCDRGSGRCASCIKGKTGDVCDINCNTDCTVCNRDNANSCTECKDGRWGPSCNKPCNTNCKSVVDTTVGKCNMANGVCSDGCKTGLYGIDCSNDCRSNCRDGLCDQTTGDCINGCAPGKIGSNCTIDCEAGRYGDNCTSKCGNCADVTPCDVNTGSCGLVGCADGFQGPVCKERLPLCACTVVSPVVSGVIGVLCGILGSVAVFLSYHFYKKRRKSSQPKEDSVPDYVYSNTDLSPATSTTDDTLTTGYQNIPTNTRNVDYVNQSFNTEDNTINMYDTLDHTTDDTNNTYTSIDSNKTK